MPPASGDARYALIVAVSEYADSKLHALAAPRNDADRLAAVLRHPEIGGFRSVQILLDPDHSTARREIEAFFAARASLDIAVLHFSGHAFRGEEHDQLFLAMSDTTRESPLSTALSGDFLRGVLAGSKARRKLVLLDCCHSGAFQLRGGPGTAPAHRAERLRAAELFTAGVRQIAPAETQPPENAMGTVVIGAARAPEVSQETENGALTAAVVEGLETGDADVNRTGQISTENLFEYVTEWFRAGNLRQHPVVQQRSRSGRFIIARNRMYQPVALPAEVERLLLDPEPERRAEAVHHLRLLAVNAGHDVADTAFRRLQHLHQFDFADQVTTTAAEALYGMAPSARPERVDFGRLPVGAAVPARTVRILVPPPARGWRLRPPRHPALEVSRDGDGLQVRLDTARAGRIDTTAGVESAAGTLDIPITARISGPSWWATVARWRRGLLAGLAGRPDAGDGRSVPARVLARWRRPGVAVLAAALVLVLLTSVHRVPRVEVLGPCLPADDLRVLTTDALRDAIEAAAAGFRVPVEDNDCSPRVTVSTVTSDGVAQRQLAQQWPDDDLRVAGPSPDVWLPESSVQVALARAAIPPDAPLRLALPDDPARLSVASSPLMLALPETVAEPGTVDPAELLGGKWVIPRADPRNSSAGLLATAALYGGAGEAGPPAAERVLGRGQGGDDARYDLCTFRLSGAAPPDDTAFLLPEKYLTDYRQGNPLGAACQAAQKPPLNRGLQVVRVAGAPALDVPCVPILESAWGDDQQHRLATEFCRYLRGDGAAELQKHGLKAPDPQASGRNPDLAAATDVITQWSDAQRPVRMLLVMDVSGSMDLPMPGAGTSRIEAIKAAARRAVTGRSLRTDDQVGLWEFATRLNGDRDYRELVPLSDATADQQTRLADRLAGLTASDNDTGLYDTVAAGIAKLRAGARPDAALPPVNLLVVLTDGENDDPGSIGVAQIGADLRGSGVQVSVIASVGANCRLLQPLVEQGLSCFDADRGGLDAAFEKALPSRRAAS